MALSIPSASPAVNFREIDLSGSIAGNAPGSVGVIAGSFSWGPVAEPVLVSNEAGLVSVFGAPNTLNTIDFHSAAYFLRYANSLSVIREIDSTVTARNSFSVSDGAPLQPVTTSPTVIRNTKDFEIQEAALGLYSGDSASDPSIVRGVAFAARYPGDLGDNLELHICPADTGDSVFDAWAYRGSFDGAPSTSTYAAARDATFDELHAVVVDATGVISGTKGAILETYSYLSAASDAKGEDGRSNYIGDILNARSEYVHFASWGSSLAFDSDDSYNTSATLGTATTPGTTKAFVDGLPAIKYSFKGGENATTLATADYLRAFDLIEDPELTEADLIIAPSLILQADQVTVVADLVATAGTLRKDALVVASPHRAAIVNATPSTIVASVKAFADALSSSSYLSVDGNFLKVYDKYNDKYITIPAASSTAGLMAATDRNAAPWFSPAGTRRGNYLGVTDISWNPSKTQRDTLYKAGVNPIVNLNGQGVMLYGDKTMLKRPSAFDRINVRRLFLKLEKDIIAYAKTILFEFNDEFTRGEFVGVVEPYLRDVMARRGISDFRIVCDTTNNTSTVIDNNEFVASIFIKPARSINYITLNFVAVRSGASFEEIVG